MYVFRFNGSDWVQEKRLSASSHFLPVLQNDQFSASDESIFGYSLRISKVNTLAELTGAGQSLVVMGLCLAGNGHVVVHPRATFPKSHKR